MGSITDHQYHPDNGSGLLKLADLTSLAEYHGSIWPEAFFPMIRELSQEHT